ncbi:MAG: AI-2E family transporter [Alphaproteobacteria bacterium]|nr:AI-2E family transporter [Alphaproteobacteria bacterium]
MTQTTKISLFWLGVAIIFGLLIYALWGILLPFVAGFILAYILNPLVVKLKKHRINRTWATGIVIAGLLLAVFSCFFILFPVLEAQIISFVMKVPQLANTLWEKVQPLLDLVKTHISEQQLDYVKDTLSNKTSVLMNDMGSALLHLFTGWSALFNVASFFVITPVVSFYLLNDWEKITTKVKELYPIKYADFINTKIKETDVVLSAFIRGQSAICLFLALFYGFGLTLINLDFGFTVGFIAGLFSFVPYVGTLTGFALSILIAITQASGLSLFLGILVVFGIGQFLEGYVLTPRLVGNKVGLHPVWVIFALFAGSYLFGFLGMLIAVPVFAVLGVVVRTAIDSYKNSVYYKGK